MPSDSSQTTRNWRVAVIGSGPAGMYAAEALLKRGAAVDVFEKEFAPFGLVRYGVAPDHQKIKRTQAVFERTLNDPALRLFTSVEIGRDLHVEQLRDHYDQVLVALGCPSARDLEIPGERLENSVSATDLVNWYNGHPRFVTAAPSLRTQRVVVVGMGNVAIDVARILLREPADLASTDISPSALDTLRHSQVREVILLARRGPNQAAFEEKEVRELAALPGIVVCTDGYTSRRKTPKSIFLSSFPRASATPLEHKRVVFHFCLSPKEVLGTTSVQGVRVERNTLVESAARMKAVGTGKFSEIECGLLVRAVGYHGVAVPGIPFCDATGTVPNAEGRVLDRQDGEVVRGMYVTGWAKRGPTGLIGTNKSCAQETVALMESDLDQVGPLRDEQDIKQLLGEKVRYLSKEDWNQLNAWELSEGKRLGTARRKILSHAEALAVLDH